MVAKNRRGLAIRSVIRLTLRSVLGKFWEEHSVTEITGVLTVAVSFGYARAKLVGNDLRLRDVGLGASAEMAPTN